MQKMKQMKHFKGENAGRSMTEMLGVLAIIGVLSVGGVVGYRYAMNYYAANQIAYEVNLMRNDAKIKIAQGAQELSLGNPYDKQGDENGHLNYNESYKVAFDFTEDPEAMPEEEAVNGYYIELSGIPQGICNPLANLLNNMSERAEFKVNESNECNQETNTLYVAFEAENLSGNIGEPGFIPSCDDENCNGYCNDNDECVCNSSADCKDGLACMGGTCGTCEGEGDCNPAHCKDGKCITCGESEHWSGSDCVADCTPATCTNGQACNTESGECVDDCTTANAQCQNGYHCDATSKHCEENTAESCLADGSKAYNSTTGECVDDCTSDNAECQNGYHCDANDTKTCVVDCTPETCAEGQACNTESGECVSDCTIANAQCQNGYHCNTTSKHCEKNTAESCLADGGKAYNTETGECVSDCTSANAECQSGYHCDTNGTKKCVADCTPATCSGTTPYCNEETGICEKCTDDISCGEGEHCKADGSCATCNGTTPYWNATTKQCEACSGTTPAWDSTTGTCKSCYEVYGQEKPKWSGSECVTCESGTRWNTQTNTCEAGGECQTNADCKAGQYCYLYRGKSCDSEFDSSKGYGIGYSNSYKGECHKVSDDLPADRKIQLQNSAGKTITYHGSNVPMTWWSACRLCAARAGQSDSVCASGTSGTTNEPDFMAGWGDPDFKCAHEINPGTGGDWGYCHADETTGKTSSSSSNVSETIMALRKMYNSSSYYLWLRNNYSSCNAYYVGLSSGYVGTGNRSYLSYYALCR